MNTKFEKVVDVLLRLRRNASFNRRLLSPRRRPLTATGKCPDPRTINTYIELTRVIPRTKPARTTFLQLHLEAVITVGREVPPHGKATARSKRQILAHSLSLIEVSANVVSLR